MSFYVYLIFSCVLAASGMLSLKQGAAGNESVYEFVNTWILCGLCLYAFGMVLWLYVLNNFPLTKVYPFTMLTFVLVGIGSIFLLKEPVNAQIMIGWGVILIGVGIVSAG